MRNGGRGGGSRFDLDGTRNDMGFVGGPDADPSYWLDADGDGVPVLYDCDDTNSAINPEADEVCDDAGVDENCNGLINADDPSVVDGEELYVDADGDGFGAEGTERVLACPGSGFVDNDDDCDDTNVAIVEEQSWYADADGDGFGAGPAEVSCRRPEGFVGNDDDCDDTNAAIGASRTWYADNDGDGVGDASVVVSQCDAPDGYVSLSGDCDDTDASVSDGATWYADNDDGFGPAQRRSRARPRTVLSPTTTIATTPRVHRRGSAWFADDDGDGFGDNSDTVTDCGPPDGGRRQHRL